MVERPGRPPNPDAEGLKIAAYGHLRAHQLEPPGSDRLARLLKMAVARRKQRLVDTTPLRIFRRQPARRWHAASHRTDASESDTDQLP